MPEIFERNYRCYGSRRMHATLVRQPVTISEKVVRRLMKQESLVQILRKRRRYGSYMGEISPAPDNLFNRDFTAGAPNKKWLTDITEFQIPAGKVYLSRWRPHPLERMLADPRRIVQIRKDLNLGQTVRFMDCRDGQVRTGRIWQ